MIKDLELINNIKLLTEKKIVLYGASKMGINIFNRLKEFEIDILAYCDSDSKKWNTELLGKKIISLDSLVEIEEKNLIVIITSCFTNEIIEILENEKRRKFEIYTAYAANMGLIFNGHTIKSKRGLEYLNQLKINYDIERNLHIHGTKRRVMLALF